MVASSTIKRIAERCDALAQALDPVRRVSFSVASGVVFSLTSVELSDVLAAIDGHTRRLPRDWQASHGQ